MSPDEETKQCNRDRLVSNESVTENPLVTVYADQIADHAESRQDHDVNSRVAVKPEEVLERHWIPVEFRIKNPDVHDPFSNQ